MFGWIGKGLRTGVLTSRYPRAAPEFQGWTVPQIDAGMLRPADCRRLAQVCPTGALSCHVNADANALVLDYRRCISCALCARALPATVTMTDEIELSAHDPAGLRVTYLLRREEHGR